MGEFVFLMGHCFRSIKRWSCILHCFFLCHQPIFISEGYTIKSKTYISHPPGTQSWARPLAPLEMTGNDNLAHNPCLLLYTLLLVLAYQASSVTSTALSYQCSVHKDSALPYQHFQLACRSPLCEFIRLNSLVHFGLFPCDLIWCLSTPLLLSTRGLW